MRMRIECMRCQGSRATRSGDIMEKKNSDQGRELQASEIRRKIDQGWTSLQRGKAIDGEEFFRQLEREERELLRNAY